MVLPPLDLNARLLYRDALMLVLDKPAGIPVHRGPDNAEARRRGQEGIALEAYFDQLRFGLPRVPALAHRLDRDTSGCLVLGRHRRALERLGGLFKRGEVDKTYWAVVRGGPPESEGRIDLALGRRDASRGWWMKPDPAGQPAATLWRVLGRGADEAGVPLALLALTPLTGRTHQLRVHCQSQGWPILGDPIYGEAAAGGLHLHAREIVVPLYRNREPVRVAAPLPETMLPAVRACGVEPPPREPQQVDGEGEGNSMGEERAGPAAAPPVQVPPPVAPTLAGQEDGTLHRRTRPASRWETGGKG
jgi:tRNA pseudouridine32 synthase / 23S rRNA pseudouridine746 synthase